MKLLKKVLLPFICMALIIPTSLLASESQPFDKIEAVVNQEIILSSDIKRMQKDVVNRYTKKGQTLPAGNELQKQILDKLITDRLQLQVAEQIGLRINDAQLNQTLQQIAKKEGLTLLQLKEQINKRGDSYPSYVEMVRDELTINEIRQVQVRRRINISDQEVKQMIIRLNEQGQQNTQFHFAHIMLKFDNKTSETNKQTIIAKGDELATQIKQGADIQTLAIAFSQGPKAFEGGDWGWRTVNEIPTLFANVFDDKKTQKGDLIGPFQTNMGIHLIKILDKKGTENVITEEVKVRHILIKSNIVLSDEKAQKRLEKFREDILEGSKTFAQLALANSQDPGSAVKGGDLGWADPAMYVPEFRDISLSMPIGEISAPFRTMHGWHILQVMDKRESDTTEDATKQKAYGMLFQQRFPVEVYAWMNEIRQEAYIKINNPDYMMDAE